MTSYTSLYAASCAGPVRRFHHYDLIQGTPGININQLSDQYLSLGSKLAAKVANPFYGTAGGVVNLAASTTTQAQLLLPFPEFGSVTLSNTDRGHALYYSFYAKAQKRMGHGLNLLTTVTWSRNETTPTEPVTLTQPTAAALRRITITAPPSGAARSSMPPGAGRPPSITLCHWERALT